MGVRVMIERRMIAAALLVAASCGLVRGQMGGQRHLFTYGIGARALGLGGACVADPRDPTALFWNPSALDLLERKSVVTFYANLPWGASLQALGLVLPTRNVGTVGFGYARIGIGGVPARSTHNEPEGTFGFEQQEILVAYAKQLLPWLSMGVTGKLERQELAGFAASALGADAGLVYVSRFDNLLLRDLRVGVSVCNLVGPRLRLAGAEGEVVAAPERLPATVRAGLARAFRTAGDGSALAVYLDIDKSEGVPVQLRMGSEYLFRGTAMVRAGLNNGAPSFGAGLAYSSFQIDYSYGWFAERDVAPNHRVSITFSFGLTKQEMVRRAELRRAQEIEEEMRARREWERRQIILSGVREGQAALDRGDYYVAFREFTRVLSIPDSVGLDPDLVEARQEAREKLRLTDQRLQEQFAQEAARRAQEREIQRRQAFVEEHFRKAQAFLAENAFGAAIRELDRILEEFPDNAQAREFRDKAVQDQRAAAQAVIQNAEREARKPGGANEAIRIYREAARIAEGQPDLVSLVEGRIARLTQELNFDNLFRQGLEERRNGNYAAAAEAFKRAMQFQPQNQVVRKHYEEALERALAKDVEPVGKARDLYREGFRLYQQNRFEEALQKFEEANREQPYVRRILQGIDAAKEQIAKAQGRQRPER